MLRSILFLATAATASLASAQALTISQANMGYTTGAAPAPTSLEPRTCDLRADALAIDHAFEHWWFFRINGDPREYALRDLGPFRRSANGSHLDCDFDNLDGRNPLKARLDVDLYSAGPAICVTYGTGATFYPYPIPAGPYLTGCSVYHQFFVADPAAPNGVAVFTNGLATTVGKV